MIVKWRPGELLLGRYEIVEEFAQGGMADLFLAINREPETSQEHHRESEASPEASEKNVVVLKMLRSFLSFDPELQTMLRDELEVMRMLRHPNVVRLLDAGEERGEQVLVLEYVRGEDLRTWMERWQAGGEQLSVPLVLALLEQLMQGIDYLHHATMPDGSSLGLIHRDISPPNILLRVDGLVKLTDFGVALHQAMSRQSAGTGIRGKFAYIAPEMLASRSIDQRADLFAWGIIAWELFAGRPLFRADSPEQTLERVGQAPIPSLRTVRPTLPASIDALVQRALSRSLQARYQSSRELLADLRIIQHELGLASSPSLLRDFLADQTHPL